MSVNAGKVEIVLEQLTRGPELVISLVEEVPEQILKKRPAPKVWSAHEHACHLPDVQPLMLERLEYLLSNPDPVITPYEPATDDPDGALLHVDLGEAMDRYKRERILMVEVLQTLNNEQWAITAEHGEYSHYSVFIMFRHLAMHDLYHAYRIEQRLLNKDWSS
jgi:hypothetical protein